MNTQLTLANFPRTELALLGDLGYAPPPRGTTKREFLAFAFRYKRRLIWAFLLPLLAAIGVALALTPRYQGDAVLIIRLGPEYVYQTANGVVGQPSQVVPFTDVQIFKSEAAILNSDSLHREVVQAIGAERLYPELLHPSLVSQIEGRIKKAIEPALVWAGLPVPAPLTPEQAQQQRLADAVKLFDENLKVSLERESAVISVSFSNPNPALVQQTLDTLLSLYMKERRQVYSQQRAKTAAQELEAARERLLSAERALDDFKAHHDVINFPAQRDALLARRNAAATEAQLLAAQAADDTQKLASLSRSATHAGSNVVQYTDRGGDTAFAASRTQLIEAQAKLKMAQERYAPTSPVVQLARKQVEDMENIMRSARASQTSVVRSGRTLTYDTIEQDRARTEAALKGAEARRTVVLAQIADLDRQLRDFDALDTSYNNLQQQVTIDRQSVDQFAHKLDNARSEDDADRNQADGVKVVQQPMVAPHPVSLRRMVVAGGALIALLIMLAVGAWTEFARSGFLTPEQLEREVGLTVLGVVPYQRHRYLPH
jgi:uncharacterized protein involved in exopolysaccharide biosynthesis